MKTLKSKSFLMTILYLFCNYLIWFGLKPCITLNGIHKSTFFPVTQNDVCFFPLCVLLPIVLFQPHIIILYREKPLKEKKQKRIFWILSFVMIVITIVVWLTILLKQISQVIAMEKEQLGFKREKIKVKQVLGLFIKLILLMILFIACFCVVYGVGEYSSYSFSHYTRFQTFLMALRKKLCKFKNCDKKRYCWSGLKSRSDFFTV